MRGVDDIIIDYLLRAPLRYAVDMPFIELFRALSPIQDAVLIMIRCRASYDIFIIDVCRSCAIFFMSTLLLVVCRHARAP